MNVNQNIFVPFAVRIHGHPSKPHVQMERATPLQCFVVQLKGFVTPYKAEERQAFKRL